VDITGPAVIGKTWVEKALRQVEGVEEMLTRAEAARKYRLNPHRIGDQAHPFTSGTDRTVIPT
jgi:hypothetical protein